jgi:hypothetical protein
MRQISYPRRLACLLLRFALKITPPDRTDWARAMLSELEHVEGNWQAMRSAFGGTVILAKHALLSAILPKGIRGPVPLGSESLLADKPLRKSTLAALVSCVVVALLFFLAPGFRQGFQVALVQWQNFIHVTGSDRDPDLDAIARRAENEKDAEALAFVAVRHRNTEESQRLSDEAVRLGPNLTWVYAVVAVHHPEVSEIDSWIQKLQPWDPQNALAHLIVAERIGIDQIERGDIPHRADEESVAWLDAMSGAFQSAKLDCYLDRLKELDRKVLVRYAIHDPYQVFESEAWSGLPSYAVWDSARYAEFLLQQGKVLESKGDRLGASEKYSTVTRFGDLLGPMARFLMRPRTIDAYRRLGEMSQRAGNEEQAVLYFRLAGQLENARRQDYPSLWEEYRRGVVPRWNASAVSVSGLVFLCSAAMGLICITVIFTKNRNLRLSTIRPGRLLSGFGLGSVLGLLFSCVTLYITYHPYAEIFRRYVQDGDESGIPELQVFLRTAQMPLGIRNLFRTDYYVFYFWLGLTVLGIRALIVMVVRQFVNHRRPGPSVAA